MKRLLITFFAVTSMLLAGPTKIGDYESGTKYSFTEGVGQNTVYGWQVALWDSSLNGGNGDYVTKFHDKQVGVYGYNNGNPNDPMLNPSPETVTGTFTVPVGKSTYRFLVAKNGVGTGGSWQYTWTDLPAGVAGTGEPTEGPKKVTVSLRNTKDFPVTYKLLDANGDPVAGLEASVTLQPGQALIQSLTVPPGTLLPLTVVYRYEGYEFTDGQWVVAENAVKEVTAASVPPDKVVDTTEPVTTANTLPIDEPSEAPSTGTPTAKSGGSVWRSGGSGQAATDALTNTVFREGVDKITARQDKQQKSLDSSLTELKAISGNLTVTGNRTAAEFPTEAPAGTAAFATANATSQGGVVNGLIGLLPAVPDVLPASISKTSTFAFTLSFPYVGNKTVSVDMSDHSTPIMFVRGMLLSFMALWFFAVSVVTIRKAFAS